MRRPYLFVILLLAACSRRDAAPPPPNPTPAVRADALPLVGRFAGTLPCADCAGIQTELTLASDWDGRALFRLRETYVGGPYDGRTVETDGVWTTQRGTPADRAAIVYQLAFTDPPHTRAFVVIDERSIRLLDADLRPLPSAVPSSLTRIDGR